jgi:hypothetical protein
VQPRSKFIRKGTPDAGVECYWLLSNGDEWAWQAKFFLEPPGPAEWRQIDDSVKTALEKHPRLARCFVCLPIDRADPRIPEQKWFMDRWSEHVERWDSWAREKQMSVEFEYWGEHEIFSRLSREEHRGRFFFWFSKEALSQRWFDEHLAEAVANAGPRYTPELNVDLPVAHLFEGLARNAEFFTQMKVLRGNLVKEHGRLSSARSTDCARDAFKSLRERVSRLRALLLQAEEADAGQIDVAAIVAAASESIQHARECEKAVREIEKAAKEAGTEQRATPVAAVSKGEKRAQDFGWLIQYLHRLSRALDEIIEFFEGRAAKLANVGALLLVGDAGTGKTHLFCDVARQRVAAGLPTVLLFGGHFAPAEPWSQMSTLLGLCCGKEELLGALDAAGHARGSRALLLIDGLNDGEAKEMWHRHLAGILTVVRRFPRVGIALTVRTSYRDVVIPPGLEQDRLVTEIHYGFAGHEYEATKTFFDHFGIERPAVPLLSPEFQNPLFLMLFCRGLRNRGLTRFPPGFHGISSVFEFFLDSVNKKLAGREYLDYDESVRPVQNAVAKLSEALADRRVGWLAREEARTLVNSCLPREGHEISLFRHLMSEGVLCQDRFWSRQGNTREEGIRFSYERLADFLVGRILLDRHLDVNDPSKSFTPDGPLGCFLKDEKTTWLNRGLVEAFSILLPERVGKELAGVAPHCADFEPVRKAFILSVIFRNPKAFSEASLDYINQHVMRYGGTRHEFMDAWLTVASIPGHPYNADLLHKHLSKFTLADRDAWWSIYLHYQYGEKAAVDRLVEWAWSPEEKTHIESESIRLAAVALAWFLTTSNRYLRDRATKALVALLAPRVGLLTELLRMFVNVNDPYVLERLCGVAYGCAMRSGEKTEVGELARELYDLFFRCGEPPPDILLRDYARGVIDAAFHLGADLGIDRQKTRPPYKTQWPEAIPAKEELENLHEWHEGMPEEQWGRLEIYNSVMGFGDFARYIIGTNSGLFEWSSCRLGEGPKPSRTQVVRAFIQSLTKKQRKLWDRFVSAGNKLQAVRFSQLIGETRSIRATATARGDERAVARAERFLCQSLGKAKLTSFRQVIVPYLNNPTRDEDEYRFDLTVAQRWILAKVLELGWTPERFGKFDREVKRYSNYGRDATKPERIGKKYQWVAYHEFLARVSDNFQFAGEPWSQKTEKYDGPWQLWTRDIDPSCLLTRTKREDWRPHSNTWWFPISYDAWDLQPDDAEWLKSSTDLPATKPLLEVERPVDRSRWLVMEAAYDWEPPTSPEEERFEVPRRSIWYMLKSYIAKRGDVEAVLEWAAKQNFMGRWMPESHELYRVFLGEFHWAPAYLYHNRCAQPGWTRGDRDVIPVEVAPTTNLYMREGNSYDCSVDETIHIYLPCGWIAEAMRLRWCGVDGRYFNQHGDLIAFDPSVEEVGPGALLMNKDRLLEFLQRAGYDILWTLLGEKDIVGGWDYPGGWKGRLIINGAFVLQNGSIRGNVSTLFESPKPRGEYDIAPA